MGCCASKNDGKKAEGDVSAEEGGLFSQRLN